MVQGINKDTPYGNHKSTITVAASPAEQLALPLKIRVCLQPMANRKQKRGP